MILIEEVCSFKMDRVMYISYHDKILFINVYETHNKIEKLFVYLKNKALTAHTVVFSPILRYIFHLYCCM